MNDILNYIRIRIEMDKSGLVQEVYAYETADTNSINPSPLSVTALCALHNTVEGVSLQEVIVFAERGDDGKTPQEAFPRIENIRAFESEDAINAYLENRGLKLQEILMDIEDGKVAPKMLVFYTPIIRCMAKAS